MRPLDNAVAAKRLFLLDIDGTVSLDSTVFEGTLEFMQQVLSLGGKYVFITNNSTKSIADYVKKFKKMGIEVDESSFLTASYAMGLYLKKQYKDRKLFVLGTKSFVAELRGFGLQITEEIEENIATVVVGFDNELNYQKIQKVCYLLETREIDYVATNPDLVCPVGFGYVPDCGAICDFIGKAVKRSPIFVGKPNRMMVDLAIEANQYTKEQTVVIGDRLYTDIACGINAEVDTIVVFTGEAKMEDLQTTEFEPMYYCNSILDIYHAMR